MESKYTWKNQFLLGVRNFAILTGIILVLVYLVLISGESAKQELTDLFVEEATAVTHIMEPVAYGYENGAKVWELRSHSADQEKETESSEINWIYELVLFKGGEENLSIRGDHGTWDKPREKLTLSGNVDVESSDGTTVMDTNILVWEERSKVLSCPEPVDFRVEDNHILSDSLYSDDDLATVDFVGNVTMFVVGLEGENFVTREGEFPVEDLKEDNKGDGMNVLAGYVHYDKAEKLSVCYPGIPLDVRIEHNLDEEGKVIPEDTSQALKISDLVLDPDYAKSVQESVAQLDLTPEELAFLAGEVDTLDTSGGLAEALQPTDIFGSGESVVRPEGISTPIGPRIEAPGSPNNPSEGISVPDLPGGSGSMGPMMGGRTPFAGGDSGAGIPGSGSLGPDIPSFGNHQPFSETVLPRIRRSDPEKILTAPDYSDITDWEISKDLNSESFELDPGFDPIAEQREGKVFCYRKNKKIWCEQLVIDMGGHFIRALRSVDGRFKDLKDEKSEPPESKAGKAIQGTPTQFIGNYMVHNWKDDITEGYGRVLVLQPEKDFEADNILYNEAAKVMHAWGDVIVHQYSGQWWETSGAIEDMGEEKKREDIKNPSVLTTDAFLSYSRQVSWAFGNVKFLQEKQVITGNRAQHEENNDILIVAGNVVYNNDDGEQLSCALLTLDLEMDEYIAEGTAVARSKVPEEYRDNLAEFKDDEENRKPEDDARSRLLQNRTAEGLGDWSDAIANPPPPPIDVIGKPSSELQDLLGPDIAKPFTLGGEGLAPMYGISDGAVAPLIMSPGMGSGVTPGGTGSVMPGATPSDEDDTVEPDSTGDSADTNGDETGTENNETGDSESDDGSGDEPADPPAEPSGGGE